MLHRSTILAAGDANIGGVIGWSLVLFALVIGGFFAVIFIRKWVSQEDTSSKVGFTLGDMREMLRNGQITQEEYDKAKNQMIEATQRAAERQTAQLAEEMGAQRGTLPKVTDVDEIRKRAKRNQAGGEPPAAPSV